MSGHRRVKDIAYDDEELEDYSEDEYDDEGEEELSPDDKRQMREGTTKVRDALGPGSSVSDKEIQDALWHYYYDVAKSVSFLKNLRAPPTAKKQKEPSKFDQASSAAQVDAKKTLGRSRSSFMSLQGPAQCYNLLVASQEPDVSNDETSAYPVPEPFQDFSLHLTATDFFKDVSWGHVPSHLRSKITVRPVHPRARLLGGSSSGVGKTSKLAALAAARKKREAEQKAAAEPSTGEDGPKWQPSAISILDRLSTKPRSYVACKENGQPSAATTGILPPQVPQSRTYPIRRKKSPSPVRPPIEEPLPVQDTKPEEEAKLDLRAPPSTFARAIVGKQTRSSPESLMRPQEDSAFKLLYADSGYVTDLNPFAGPSPDDVVTNAQSKGAKGKASVSIADGEKSTNGVADAVSSLSLEEATNQRVKSKNLNVLAEFEKSKRKDAASFVVIGHVDHGKSTLMGRLLYDLKVIDQRSIDKLRKEATNIGKSSFALAWVMDSTSEERERGVTVDIATNYFETEKTKFTILDAPGHRDFIPNMIAGASQADFAVLVIDASTNSFESGLRGQTKEHALLVRSMGVQRLIIAVNKMDLAGWSQDRFIEIEQQMSAFLTSAGFQAKNITFIPCAGLTGENIVRKVTKDKMPWYTGHTLVEELEGSEPAKRAIEQPLRLSIADVFRGGITNPLSVSGRVDAGSLQVGEQIIAMPSGEKAHIKGIEVDQEPAEWAVAGQIATLHLTGIDEAHLRIGDIICSSANPIKNTKAFTTKLLAFEHVMPMYVDVHRGRLHVPGKITQMLAVLDKSSGEVTKKKPRVVQPGSVARVRVELETAIPLEAPGRIVLRNQGQTVAAGLLESAE
ncbi:elongation factor Tu GTP binding domain-containing protein [Cryomyces antarcticus]